MGLLIVIIIASIAIGYFMGTKRYIGLGWSIFFCLTGSIIFGLVVILSSNLKTTHPRRFNSTQNVFAWISIIFGTVGFFGLINASGNTSREIPAEAFQRMGQALSVCTFFIGLGIYLIQSNTFNKKYHSGQIPIPPVTIKPIINPSLQSQPVSPQNSDLGGSGSRKSYNGGHNSAGQTNFGSVVPPVEGKSKVSNESSSQPNESKETRDSKEFKGNLYGKN